MLDRQVTVCYYGQCTIVYAYAFLLHCILKISDFISMQNASKRYINRVNCKQRNKKESFFASRGENDWQAIKRLCYFLYRHHKVLPIILVDEYDTPLLEAYTQGYWDEMIATCRQIFHNAFKQNDYYSRAIITGVARISKNSLFSDLNNLEVDTVTCEAYADCFGFTEEEGTDAQKY